MWNGYENKVRQLTLYFIRHGMTAGNEEKRYIGKTDESLSEAGIEALKANAYPEAELIISGPMKRCRETAELIYPGREITVFNAIREIDFGDFEGKNYQELEANPDYQRWVDSGGRQMFPGGEAVESYMAKQTHAILDLINETHEENIAIICHGGTIMSFLAMFEPVSSDRITSYYNYQVKNGEGYVVRFSCFHDDEVIYDGSERINTGNMV